LEEDTTIILAENYPNGNDTATFNYVVNSIIAGRRGYLIVQSTQNNNSNTNNADTTGILVFNKPYITTNDTSLDTLIVGAPFTITGTYFCTDTIALYYSFDSTEWTFIAYADMDSLSNNYKIDATIPCLNVFDCIDNKNDTTIYGRIVYKYRNTTDSVCNDYPLTITPANFPITIPKCEGICPSVDIYWTITDSNLVNDSLTVLFSLDSGATFNLYDVVSIANGMIKFNIPANTNAPILIRLCGKDNCLKSDTILHNYNTKYIKTVAPNPFKRANSDDELTITYIIEENVNATMRIIDQANRYVAYLIDNEERKGGFIYCEKWNARLKDGTSVANGMYYILLELSNGYTEVYPLYIRN
jgi:hypothetical protein